MTLRHDAPVEVNLDDVRPRPTNVDVRRLFDFLEFKSMHAKFRDAMSALGIATDDVSTSDSGPLSVRTIDTHSDVRKVVAAIEALEVLDIAPAWEGEAGRSELLGVSVVLDRDACRTLWIPRDQLVDGDLRVVLERVRFRTHEGKGLIRGFLDLGIDPTGLEMDTAIAEYLIDPGSNSYSLRDLLAKHSGTYYPDDDAASSGRLDLDSSQPSAEESSGRDALAIALVAEPLTAALKTQGMLDLYSRLENSLVRVLARMEQLGIGVDVVELRKIADRLTTRARELSDSIQSLAGHPFNPNSPTQLAKILFEERGLTPPKKTKT
jgi:DNA polymerase-1